MNKSVAKKMKQRSAGKPDIELGKRIRLRRVEQRISQADLGDKLGVSLQQVQGSDRATSVGVLDGIDCCERRLAHRLRPPGRSRSLQVQLGKFSLASSAWQVQLAAPRTRSINPSGSAGNLSPRQATCWSGRDNTSPLP